MPLDPRIQSVLETLPPKAASNLTPAERREEARISGEKMAGVVSSVLPALADERDVVAPSPAGGVRVRVYRPRPGVLPCYILIHGGGWWLGSVDENDSLCRRRARDADCVVVSIDYRLAPEHPYPAPLDDCWTATRWVFDSADQLGIDAKRVTIGGGSAGANLAAAVTLLARDDNDVSFVAQVLEVPATDLTLAAGAASADEFATGYGLSKQDLIECVGFYLGDADPTDPLVSPLLADLRDLPPALVMTSEYDPVRDDGEAYAAKLGAAGVATTFRRWDGIVHGAGEADGVIPDIAQSYRQQIRAFLRNAFASDRDTGDPRPQS